MHPRRNIAPYIVNSKHMPLSCLHAIFCSSILVMCMPTRAYLWRRTLMKCHSEMPGTHVQNLLLLLFNLPLQGLIFSFQDGGVVTGASSSACCITATAHACGDITKSIIRGMLPMNQPLGRKGERGTTMHSDGAPCMTPGAWGAAEQPWSRTCAQEERLLPGGIPETSLHPGGPCGHVL